MVGEVSGLQFWMIQTIPLFKGTKCLLLFLASDLQTMLNRGQLSIITLALTIVILLSLTER